MLLQLLNTLLLVAVAVGVRVEDTQEAMPLAVVVVLAVLELLVVLPFQQVLL
jgi:hypothetical protein